MEKRTNVGSSKEKDLNDNKNRKMIKRLNADCVDKIALKILIHMSPNMSNYRPPCRAMAVLPYARANVFEGRIF